MMKKQNDVQIDDTHKITQEDDPNVRRKNGLLYLNNVRQIRVNGKDILPDLLRIIKDNPAP